MLVFRHNTITQGVYPLKKIITHHRQFDCDLLKKVFHFLHLTGGVKYDCNNNIQKYKFQVKRKYLHFLLKKPYLGILKKVIPFLKSAPSNSSKTKSREKKTINLGPKMPYLGVLKPQF